MLQEAVGAMIVFDVTRISTFEAVAKWKADIDAKVFFPLLLYFFILFLCFYIYKYFNSIIYFML